jgi:hypothetical protein
VCPNFSAGRHSHEIDFDRLRVADLTSPSLRTLVQWALKFAEGAKLEERLYWSLRYAQALDPIPGLLDASHSDDDEK